MMILKLCLQNSTEAKIDTRPLQNAKVMAREKQGEAAEKVMSMGKNQLKNILS